MKQLCFLFFVFFFSFVLNSDDFLSKTKYVSNINWKKNTVNLNFITNVDDISKNRESAFYLAEESSNLSFLKKYITTSIMKIRVNSDLYLKEIDYISLKNILDMQLKIQNVLKSSSKPAVSMDNVALSYSIPIYPYISSFLVDNQNESHSRDNLAWRPVQDYTGLVIYAKGLAPVHGNVFHTHLKPAMFPKIYDEDMNLVLSKENINKQSLINQGAVAYTDSFDEKDYRDRIGPNPLRISLMEIYGKNNTDLIISDEYAQKLIYSENNYDIIRKGKILVIIRKDEIYEELK